MFNKSKKLILGTLFAVILMSALFFTASVVMAQTTTSAPDLGLQPVGESIGLPTTDIRLVVARIIRTALGLLGIVAVVLILYGGFVWMTAGGDEEKVSQAKKILFNSVIGLAIILSSFAIASFVISRLVTATGGEFSGGTGTTGGENPYFPAGTFYVDSLPSGGTMCIRNVHLAITFNKSVDIDTLNGNVVIQNAQGDEEPGQWQAAGETSAVFVPTRDCGSGAADCFAPSTTYTLHFANPSAVRNADGDLTLNCAIRAGCADVEFTTGNGVDRVAPVIRIEPIANDSLVSGATVPVVVRYTDDNGVQKVDLSADSYFVGSQTISGCQQSGSVTVNWPTAGIGAGQHTLTATGFDWAALSYATSTLVNLLPQHCFDANLQADLGEVRAGPPACGGECGACGGSACTTNTQCSSGYCDTTAGRCVEKMRINGVSPLSGGPGTLVSIAGSYFGATPGRVFINNVQMPLATTCGAGAWKPWQIIVEVPNGASSGPIRVETASSTSGIFIDTTNDNFGPMVSDFTVNSVVRPGLCSISPESGQPFAEVSVVGRRLGAAPGQVSFGGQQVVVSLVNWAETVVKARVPQLTSSAVGVKVTQNNVDSNSVRFFVEQGQSDSAPIISGVSPDRGAKGSYITITGRNFGDQIGRVWFKENINGQPGDAIEGNFSFPSGCATTWTDTQVIVKFPAGSGEAGKSYFIQIRPSDAAIGWSQIGPVFNLENGDPAPGICKITPASGPAPFAGSATAQIVGEYFGTNPQVYFWSENGSSTAATGRLLAGMATASNLSVGQSVATQPPAGTRTGPVVVKRSTDDALSNPANFSVLDCVRNNNTCTAPNTHCCAAGADAGWCRPNNQLCAGETISSGYIWRISTKEIPKVPRVVERCDAGTDLGLNIPSPSPSVQWDANAGESHHNVCRSASVVVEFSTANINDISRSDFVINECQANSVNETNRTCTVVGVVPMSGSGNLAPQASTQSTSYLEINPDASYNGGKWKDSTWYQVVLKSGITSGSGTSTLPLAKDKSCGADSAYCFVFRSDAQDCRMKRVVITPYSYWTSILEEPIKQRQSTGDEGEDVLYSGHGLSTQRCIVMNTGAFSWSWDTQDDDYAEIFSTNNNSAKVSAIANTVGVGLTNPSNAVNVTAQATLASANFSGVSPLTVDLNNPEVVDFWPKCLQSCTNAEVGVRFNTTMSNRNLPGSAVNGPVKLLKCNDENCLSTTPVLSSVDVVLDGASDYKILKIANSASDSLQLEPNTIYKVVLSASTTSANSSELLWSAARLGDPNTFSKPYDKEFTWRFKTKAEPCKISRVDVLPQTFVGSQIGDKKLFNAQPYSSPDSCSAQGQKLNPWSVGWNWTTSDNASAPNVVATVQAFSSRGVNNFCTTGCVRKGSSLAVGADPVAMCGNGVVEAGEDCDQPLSGAGCGLNCRRVGNTNTATCGNGVVEPNLGETCDTGIAGGAGCASNCLRSGSAASTAASATSASICGNGSVGLGEDCDIGSTGTGAGNPALQNNLVGWWTLNTADMSSAQIRDISGQGNNGTKNSSVETVAGKLGQALSFSGDSADSVTFPTPVVNTTTIAFWYKTNTLTLPAGHRMAISGGSNAAGGTYLSLFGSGTAKPFVSFRIGATQRTLDSNVPSVVDRWTHVAASWDGARIRIYVDGVLRNTSADFSGEQLIGFGGGEGYIGKYQANTGYEFSGAIDDVRVYSRVLSASEITDLYQFEQSTTGSGAAGCSATCLNTGTKLSNNWCYVNAVSRGGFAQAVFDAACKNAISRCGDGVTSPDEDAGCDLGAGRKAAWCNDRCITSGSDHPECAAGSEGCGSNRQNIGSSLLYTTPSLCGDGVAGIGEDAFCETNLSNARTGVNPWALATGVGLGTATGVPATQRNNIIASTNENTTSGSVSDSGEFVIPCGFSTDAQCQARMGSDWAVATNGCCYMRPKLVEVFPGATSSARFNICPNTAIEATFNQPIDAATLRNNVIVARGTTSSTCATGEDVTALALADANNNQAHIPWYKKVVASVVGFFKRLTGQTAEALRTEIRSTRWCAGSDLGQPDIVLVSSSPNKITFKLAQPLATDTDYFIGLRDGIRSKQGMSVGTDAGKPIGWKFITGSNVCEVERVAVDPSQVYFNQVNATSTLVASAYSAGANRIQPIPGFYDWSYLWQPFTNSYVSLQPTTSSLNTITAKNQNGEIDVRASAIITSNIYSAQSGMVATGKSRAIVFLCENPWPPKDLFINGSGPYIIFPYEDKVGNNDQYDLVRNVFNNLAIPASPSGGYFNFRTYYCADSGVTGTADDLPYLRPAVQVDPSIVSDGPTSSLKRFIFSNTKNSDGIGVSVFSNPLHLTVSEWFERDRAAGGQGFAGAMQSTKIDGYDAITDGNNIYVDALNYSNTSQSLFSNIYLFSINANARPETRTVFEQLMRNLRFNTNLTNYGYCGLTINNPGASTACQTDLDCTAPEICSVQTDKLKRNYTRLRDLGEIQQLLGQ